MCRQCDNEDIKYTVMINYNWGDPGHYGDEAWQVCSLECAVEVAKEHCGDYPYAAEANVYRGVHKDDDFPDIEYFVCQIDPERW